MPGSEPSLAETFLEKEESIVASEETEAKAGGEADSAVVANSAFAAEGTWEKVDSRALSPVTASGASFELEIAASWIEEEATDPPVSFAAVIEPLATFPCLTASALILGAVIAFFLIFSAVTAPGRSWNSPTDLSGSLVAA